MVSRSRGLFHLSITGSESPFFPQKMCAHATPSRSFSGEGNAEAGVSPEFVDYVMCPHLHVDHCGWNTRLLDGRWVPTLPNAKHVFSKTEYEHWRGPAGKEGVNAGVCQGSVLPVIESGQAFSAQWF